MADAVFEKDGKQSPFRKASLGRDADSVDDEGPLGLSIRGAPATPKKKAAAGKKKTAAKRGAAVRARAERKTQAPGESPVVALLKEWRRAQAKKQGVPTFRIMSDRVLLAIAEDQPGTLAELLAIPGIGLKTVEKYGAQIYKILNQARG
jgi:superfamily II DNA helicase RecQ